MTTGEVGIPLTEEHVALSYDGERDHHSLEQRLKAWRWQEAMYLRSLEQPLVVVPEKEHDIYFFTGDRGEGKSTAAAALALYLRCYGGYQVYSTNSFLFGERVAPITSLAFSQSLPLKSIQFTDEAHTIADASADGAYRNRAASDSVALMRKDKIFLLLASVHERRVSSLLRDDAKWLIRPETMRDGTGRRAFPPWCYIQYRVAGPYPWRGRTRMEELGQPRTSGPLTVELVDLPPMIHYVASMLMDSWDKPELLAAMELDADRMRRHTRGIEQTPELQIASALESAINEGDWRPDGQVHWRYVATLAGDHGCDLSARQIREVLQGRLRTMNTTGRLQSEELLEVFFEDA